MSSAKPRRSPGQNRKFGSLRILRDGRVRFSEWTLAGLPELDVLAVHWTFPERGRPVFDSVNYGIDVRWRGQSTLLLFLRAHRVQSACFAYTLSPAALREALSVLRTAGNGLERWIVPALEYTQADLFGSTLATKQALLRAIPGLLDSVRELPVAEPWQRERRAIRSHWEQRLREHPEDTARVPAPWVTAPAPKRGTKTRRRPSPTAPSSTTG